MLSNGTASYQQRIYLWQHPSSPQWIANQCWQILQQPEKRNFLIYLLAIERSHSSPVEDPKRSKRGWPWKWAWRLQKSSQKGARFSQPAYFQNIWSASMQNSLEWRRNCMDCSIFAGSKQVEQRKVPHCKDQRSLEPRNQRHHDKRTNSEGTRLLNTIISNKQYW